MHFKISSFISYCPLYRAAFTYNGQRQRHYCRIIVIALYIGLLSQEYLKYFFFYFIIFPYKKQYFNPKSGSTDYQNIHPSLVNSGLYNLYHTSTTLTHFLSIFKWLILFIILYNFYNLMNLFFHQIVITYFLTINRYLRR